MKTVLLVAALLTQISFGADLANPGWEITLGEFGEIYRPGMALMIGNNGYFTNATGKKDCPGKNIFHFPIVSGRREPTELAKVECLLDLQTDGHSLFVTYRNANTTTIASVGEGGRLIPVGHLQKLPEIQRNAHEARLAWVLDYVDKPKPESEPALLSGARLSLSRRAQGGVWFDLFSHQGTPALAAPAFAPGATPAVEVFPSQDGKFLFLLEDLGDWTKIQSVNTTSANGPVLITGEQVPRDSSEWDFRDWSVRSAQFYGGIPGGAYVYEGARDAQMVSGIYLMLPQINRIKRVALPSAKFLSGVSFARGGFLVSRPSQRTVQWYGNDREVFTQNEVAVSDIRRNPAVLDAEDVERQKE